MDDGFAAKIIFPEKSGPRKEGRKDQTVFCPAQPIFSGEKIFPIATDFLNTDLHTLVLKQVSPGLPCKKARLVCFRSFRKEIERRLLRELNVTGDEEGA